MVTIIFETHASSQDNEQGLASGLYDAALSEPGRVQARELGARYASQHLDAVFHSALTRSRETAQLAFGHRGFPLIEDSRLNECDYGDLTRHPTAEIDAEREGHIAVPFPKGESFEQAAQRMRSFLKELIADCSGKRVMIIGHRATQYGLEHWINRVSLRDAVTAPWRWQPGWTYHLHRID